MSLCVIGAAHQGAALNMFDSTRETVVSKRIEYTRRDIFGDFQMLPCWLKVLTKCEDRQLEFGELVDDLFNFFAGLTEAQHDPCLCECALRPGMFEHGKAAFVAGLNTDLSTQTRHGLKIVCEHVGVRSEDGIYASEVALEIGDQDLDRHGRGELVAGIEGRCPYPSAAVDEVVAVYRCDNRVVEIEFAKNFGNTSRFVFIHGLGATRCDITETTRACANVAEDHDGERFVVPALSNVGAARALAHRVELEVSHSFFEAGKLGSAGHLHTQPRRMFTTGTRRVIRGIDYGKSPSHSSGSNTAGLPYARRLGADGDAVTR